jgi:hypothetical protein
MFGYKIVRTRRASDEEVLRLVGALTINELVKSRKFRRTIQNTSYGKKVLYLIDKNRTNGK